MDCRAVSSMGSGSTNTGLLRQSSSPAGLFLYNLNNIEGYGALKGTGSFGTSPREASNTPAIRFGNPVNLLSAGQPSSSGHMSLIAEVGNRDAGKSVNSRDGGGLDEGHGNNSDTDFPPGSWDESGLNASEVEAAIVLGRRGPSNSLAHRLSLPRSSSEIVRLLQIQVRVNQSSSGLPG